MEKETEEDHISLGLESKWDSDGGEIETISSQATPKKSTRGRKSKKKEKNKPIYLFFKGPKKLSRE